LRGFLFTLMPYRPDPRADQPTGTQQTRPSDTNTPLQGGIDALPPAPARALDTAQSRTSHTACHHL